MDAELKHLISTSVLRTGAASFFRSAFLRVLFFLLTILVLHASAESLSPTGQRRLSQKIIESRLGEKGRSIIFSSDKYEKERQIVRHLGHIEDFENSENNPRSKAEIGIALVDLNNDGRDEIIAYIASPEFCGSHGCALLILERERSGNWKVLDRAIGGTPSAVLSEKHLGYRDILYDRETTEKDVTTQTRVISRFDGVSYCHGYLKRERHVDSATGIEIVSTWICDASCNKWRLLDER